MGEAKSFHFIPSRLRGEIPRRRGTIKNFQEIFRKILFPLDFKIASSNFDFDDPCPSSFYIHISSRQEGGLPHVPYS